MRSVLAIDPGKGALGWAFGRGQELLACGLSRRPAKCTLSLGALARLHAREVYQAITPEIVFFNPTCNGDRAPDAVVVELMASYAFSEQKGDQNDLIALATIGGQVAGQWPNAYHLYVKPSEWMGGSGVPEHITAKRVNQELARRGCAEPLAQGLKNVGRAKSLMHNVYDAVGIWLYATKEEA